MVFETSENVCPRVGHRQRRHGFTLIELLVALTLSLLVLQMTLPVFAHLRSSQKAQNTVSDSLSGWQTVLKADLANLVSPTKSGISVVQIHRSTGRSAFDELELQTFVRPGDGGRGPVQVRYVLEAAGDGSALSLVRYSQGWHDSLQTRHLLINNVSSWELNPTDKGSAASGVAPTTMPASNAEAGVLTVVLKQGSSRQANTFWSTWAIGEVQGTSDLINKTGVQP